MKDTNENTGQSVEAAGSNLVNEALAHPGLLRVLFPKGLIFTPEDRATSEAMAVAVKPAPIGFQAEAQAPTLHEEVMESIPVTLPELVVVPEAPPVAVPVKPIEQHLPLPLHQGGYGRKILVVIDSEARHIAGNDEMELLGKMLKAVGLSSKDVALLSAREPQLHAWLTAHSPQQILGFGPAVAKQFPGIVAYQANTYKGADVLLAGRLSDYLSGTAVKTTLWAAVQPFFAKPTE